MVEHEDMAAKVARLEREIAVVTAERDALARQCRELAELVPTAAVVEELTSAQAADAIMLRRRAEAAEHGPLWLNVVVGIVLPLLALAGLAFALYEARRGVR